MNVPRTVLAESLNQAIATSPPVIAILAVIAVSCIVAIIRRHGLMWAAPFITGAGILTAMCLGGALFLPGLQNQGPGYLHNRAFPIMLTVAIFAAAASMFCLGGLIGLGSRRSGPAEVATPEFTGIGPRTQILQGRLVRVALAIAWFSALMVVLGVGGPAAVLQRGHYLQYSGPRALLYMGNLLELLGAALVGFASVFAERRQRTWARIALVVIALLAFSTGSRRLGLIPALYWFGGVLARPSRRRFAMLPVVGLVAFTFAGMALTARQQPGSGLAPYLGYFLAHPGAIFTASTSQTANALAPFAFVAYSATGARQSPSDIYAALSPLPNGLAHYSGIASHFLFYSRHPLPALGTLYRFKGMFAVAVYMFLGGLVFGVASRVARRITARASSIGAVMVSTVAGYFCLKCTQYQLRTNSRIVWYLLLIVIVLGLLSIPGVLMRSARTRNRMPVRVRTLTAAPERSSAAPDAESSEPSERSVTPNRRVAVPARATVAAGARGAGPPTRR